MYIYILCIMYHVQYTYVDREMENNHVFARERIDKWRAIRIIGMIQGKITGSMLVFLSKIWYVPAIDSNLWEWISINSHELS